MAKKTPIELITNVQRHIAHGFTAVQIGKKLGISESLVSNISKGKHGPAPTFKLDIELKDELCTLNLEKMQCKLNKRKPSTHGRY